MRTLSLLSTIALSFQDFTHFDREISETLTAIGDCIDASRIYIFLNESENVVSNTAE